MSTPDIRSFLIDDTNERKFNRNHVYAHQVEQILENRHLVVPNRRNRRGAFLIIGLDHGGKCISVPVEATNDPTIWRPVTAWPSKGYEEAKLKQKGGKL
ncbi:MAG: hypothetical protein Q7T33_04570 [Dehalococcoidia bacterium]|nr:hypothetical protein [Dehalococcoidia bacterium]